MRSILKKYRNLLRFIIKFLIIYYLNKILSIYRYYILPSLSVADLAKVKYSKETSSFYLDNNKKKINTLKIEGSEFVSDLCKLGRAFNTDKSSFNSKAHRHSYTYFYDILFSRLRSKNFNFAEIGIYKNNSFKMFRKYFSKAKLYGFDFEQKYIDKAKKHKLKNTFYSHIDVRDSKSIVKNLSKFNKKFKIIIDDSTHTFDDQINVIKNCINFLETGGILIIEDIFHHKNLDMKYYKSIGFHKKYFKNIFMVECNHINKFSSTQNNDKLLVLIKK
jgi:SAM-dependent methyltransferase